MAKMMALRSRYLIPFMFKRQDEVSFNQLIEQICTMPEWNLQDMKSLEGEQDLYEMILDAFQMSETCSNIGCSLIYQKVNVSLPKMIYTNVNPEMRFRLSDAGMFLFRTGVGFFWYEVSFDQMPDVEQYILFQNEFKELTYERFVKKGKTTKRYTFENAKDPNNGILMGERIHNEIIKKLPMEVSYFADRIYHADHRVHIPDKALLFNYVVFSNDMKAQPEKMLDMVFFLTNGYNRRYKRKSDFMTGLYEPFDSAYCYATMGGCGYYAIEQGNNRNYYVRTLKKKIMTDYFLMYVLVLYQSYTILKYSNDIEQCLPAEQSVFEEDSHNTLVQLKEMEMKINVFLVKSVYASVSHINHHNNFYLYLTKKLKIKETIDSLTVGLEALKNIQQMNETELIKQQAREEEAERQAADRKMNYGLALVSLMALVSLISDGYESVGVVLKLFDLPLVVQKYGGFAALALTIVTFVIAVGSLVQPWWRDLKNRKKQPKKQN